MLEQNNVENEISVEPIIKKPSRGERIKRSIAARIRRKEVKKTKSVHSYKQEKDAQERALAKRTLEKQKKRKSS